MNIFVKKVKDLKSSEKKLIINFLVDCFSDNSGYKKSVYTNPDLDTCVLLYQNQELIGHVGITRRLVEHKINKYLVAGIGDVAIKSGLRHTGLGTKLMIEVNNLLKSQDYDIGVLFCHPKLHDFYTQSGWQKKERGKIFTVVEGILKDQRLTYLLPLKLNNDDIKIWNNRNITIGERSW